MTSFSTDALAGRTAVVTGAGGGLGGAIVAQLTAMGARVLSLDLRAPVADTALGHQAMACDIGREDDVAEAARHWDSLTGRCDILVNNAAVMPPPKPLAEMADTDWDSVFAVNLKGAYFCAKHFGAAMRRAGRGSIVNLASIAASVPNAIGAYGPSKSAILALTRQMAVEWGPMGLRANAVSPGLVRTPMSEPFYADPANLAAREAVVASRRIGVPQDIASVVGFLASDASAYVNGQEITVDGGFMATPLMNIQKRD